MPPERTVQFTADPLWPWSAYGVGPPALAAVAVLLALLTAWTYAGTGVSRRRMLTVLALRLAALALALLVIARPSLAVREEPKNPSVLIVAADASESMTVRDEFNNQSRWDVVKRSLARAEAVFEQLRAERNVTVVKYRFAAEVNDYDPDGRADGKRTDLGTLLATLNTRHGTERSLRGVVLLSDGADNGVRTPTLAEAARWRGLAPVQTFGLGQTTTSSQQRDVAVTDVGTEPVPVPVKKELTVRAVVDAAMFENATVQARLFIDDKPVPILATIDGKRVKVEAQPVTLKLAAGNEIRVVTDAPDKPGEVKVTLKLDPLPGEVSTANNEISTYATVTKEGLSVLYVDRLRPERKAIIRALGSDPRVRLYTAVVQTDEPTPGEADRFGLDSQAYDVILVGDVSAAGFTGGRPGVLEKVRTLVRDKGVGLMVVGGASSFGGTRPDARGGWAGTPVADLLPVGVESPGEFERPLRFVPTAAGLSSYRMLRLGGSDAENKAVWGPDKLNAPRSQLVGANRLGRVKPGAAILARADDADRGEPLLVAQTVGQGRVLAFAADTTHRWDALNPVQKEGVNLHTRFWRQLMLWLAKQEEVEGSVFARPEIRRLPAGGKQTILVGMKGKAGNDVADARFETKVVGPDGAEVPVPTAREREATRGTFWKTDKAGEYRVLVKGTGKDADGSPITGEAAARFVVYQDDAETLQQAANHQLLERIAADGGGKFRRAEELSAYLQELVAQPALGEKPTLTFKPDWRKPASPWFLPAVLLAFVGLLGLEWGLRRYWGMV